MWLLTHAPAHTHTHTQQVCGDWVHYIAGMHTTLNETFPVGELNQFDSSDTNKLPALSSRRSRVSPDLCSPPVSLHCTLDSLVSGQFCQRPLMTRSTAKVCPPILLLISVCKSGSLFVGISITRVYLPPLNSDEMRWIAVHKMYNAATIDYFYYCLSHLLWFLIKR